MTTSKSNDYCMDCGSSLELYPADQPRPPCPKCGSTKRSRVVNVEETVIHTDKINVKSEGSKTKTSYPLLVLTLILTIVSTFGSSFLIGYWAIAVGLIVGIVAFGIGFFVREKHTWSKEYEKG